MKTYEEFKSLNEASNKLTIPLNSIQGKDEDINKLFYKYFKKQVWVENVAFDDDKMYLTVCYGSNAGMNVMLEVDLNKKTLSTYPVAE